MEFESKKPIEQIKEGSYTGKIDNIEYKESTGKKGKYTNAVIQISVDGTDSKIWVRYPAFVGQKTKYGELLFRFGADTTPGLKIDDQKVLGGRVCKFIVVENGQYSNVIRESLRP